MQTTRVTQGDGEGRPLSGAGDEGSSVHGEVTSADGLRAQAVEQSDSGARRDAH